MKELFTMRVVEGESLEKNKLILSSKNKVLDSLIDTVYTTCVLLDNSSVYSTRSMFSIKLDDKVVKLCFQYKEEQKTSFLTKVEILGKNKHGEIIERLMFRIDDLNDNLLECILTNIFSEDLIDQLETNGYMR